MGVGSSTGSWTPRGGSERARALRRHQAVRFRNKIKCATTALDGQLYIFEDFLSPQRASLAFEAIDSDAFPWELEPVVYGKRVPQHSHHYKRYEGLTAFQDGFQNPGYVELGRICQKIEAEFGIKIYDVYCNRFQDPVHHNGWHKDKFGRHVMVLTLGSQRRVQFRHNKTRSIETIKPKSGDMYFMPLPVNYSHKHQVCPADENEDSGTRISLVFFFKAPKNVSEFKIKLHHQVRGFFETIFAKYQ